MVKRTLFSLAVALLLLTPSESWAACTISVTGVAFGSYNVFSSAPSSSTGSVSYSCGFWEYLFRLPISISISAGQSGTLSARKMRKGTETLTYNIFMEASASTVWGDGSGGSDTFTTRATLDSPTVTMYGMVPAGQDVSAGSYSDTVTVTVLF